MTEGAALSAYVAGKISFSALRNALVNSAEFVFQPNGTVHIKSRRLLPRTVIRADDVRRALTRYQSGELTIEELSTWGLVLYNLEPFEARASSESAQEEIWEVIGQLSLASVNDAFDAARVAELLDRLDSASKEVAD